MKDFLAKHFGFAAKVITEADVETACAGKPECARDLAEYKSASATIKTVEEQLGTQTEANRALFKSLLDVAYGNKTRISDDLRRRSILLPSVDFPSMVPRARKWMG